MRQGHRWQIAVDGKPTQSFEQLLDAGAGLLAAEHATLTILRRGVPMSLRYRRDGRTS